MLEQFAPGGLYPMEWPCVGAICKELQSVGRTHVGVHGTLSAVGGTLCWSRVRSPPTEAE